MLIRGKYEIIKFNAKKEDKIKINNIEIKKVNSKKGNTVDFLAYSLIIKLPSSAANCLLYDKDLMKVKNIKALQLEHLTKMIY